MEAGHAPGRPWTQFDFAGGAPPLPREDTIPPAALERMRNAAPAMLAALEALVDQSDRVACPICGGRAMACSDGCAVRAATAALEAARPTPVDGGQP